MLSVKLTDSQSMINVLTKTNDDQVPTIVRAIIVESESK